MAKKPKQKRPATAEQLARRTLKAGKRAARHELAEQQRALSAAEQQRRDELEASGEFQDALRERMDMALDALSEIIASAANRELESSETAAPDSVKRAQHQAARRALLWTYDVLSELSEDFADAPEWETEKIGDPYEPSPRLLERMGTIQAFGGEIVTPDLDGYPSLNNGQ